MKKLIALLTTMLLMTALITGCGDKVPSGTETPVATVEEDTTEAATDLEREPLENTQEETELATEETSDLEEDAATSDEIDEVEEIDLTGMAINPLTGEYIDETVAARRPIGVMINNHRKAQPQSGIEQADVVYEALVEGGIARLFAVFQDFDAPKIGPVRSARHYYLDFAFDFDAIYVHYGLSPQAGADIRDLNAPALNGLSGLDAIMCFQDPERVRPHATYTSYEGLMAGWDVKGYRMERDTDLTNKFNFTDDTSYMSVGMDATLITQDFSNYQDSWFEYDETTQKYNRFQFDGPQIDVETGNQLTYENIIVQFVKKWVIPGDTEGRLDMDLSTTGEGYYIREGKAIPITWDKKDHYSPTQYYDSEGNLLMMGTGKTWITIFPLDRKELLTIE